MIVRQTWPKAQIEIKTLNIDTHTQSFIDRHGSVIMTMFYTDPQAYLESNVRMFVHAVCTNALFASLNPKPYRFAGLFTSEALHPRHEKRLRKQQALDLCIVGALS